MGDHHKPPSDWVALMVCGGATMALIIGAIVWGWLSIYM